MRRALAAELDKLRTLPIVLLTVLGTVLAGAVLGAALAASAVDGGWDVDAVDATLQAVPFVQAGFVLLGVLPVAHEYAGSQIRTSLAAVPDRSLLLVAKTAATLLVACVTAVGTVAATLAAAWVVLDRAAGDSSDGAGSDGGPGEVVRSAAGAAGYLVLIAMLALAVALLLRHLVPALVGTLALVLVVSPLLAMRTDVARWLPDRAAQQLYDASDTVLTPGTGALVALGWVVAIGAVGGARLVRRDA
ncbi:hypothetical protein EDD28_0693 [Salana multivorans]|uniref:ABC-2 type transport system permease protein n=1 Tax=Salana multivorans TaxID=120377 RepID=A0A3N2D8K8_9MICO|nr:ABC transporter permease [Salana multivorans]ROR96117.1 hypothetical protein EDD28_0693 [Salana multivorans]